MLARFWRRNFKPRFSFYTGKRRNAGYQQSAHCQVVCEVCGWMLNFKDDYGENDVESNYPSEELQDMEGMSYSERL